MHMVLVSLEFKLIVSSRGSLNRETELGKEAVDTKLKVLVGTGKVEVPTQIFFPDLVPIGYFGKCSVQPAQWE